MTNLNFEKFAEQYGTPAFVFDTEALTARMAAIREIVGEKVHLCYSIKANPFLLQTMLECVEKLEVCSPGELEICKQQKASGDKIIYSGVQKNMVDINAAIEYEAGIYTAESVLQLELLNESALAHKKVIPVLLRLNAGSQFGMSKEDLYALIEHRENYKGIHIAGIHYFVGTQRKKLAEQKKELFMLEEMLLDLKKQYDFTTEKLEYGPGLPVPYFVTDDFSDTLAPLKELAADLRHMADIVELTVEMGRFYVSECGYYLTKVMDQKSNHGTNYAIVDGGMNHLNYLGQMMGMKIPVMQHLSTGTADEIVFRGTATEELPTEEEVNWSICGSLCTTADVIVRQAAFTNLQRGDTIVFANIGAYSVTEGIHLFLSRTMPRILLYHKDGTVQLARDFVETSSFNTTKVIY